MSYIALDVETANIDRSSLCQIGIYDFESNSQFQLSPKGLLNPEDYFDGFNISIHGIEPHHVEASPTFADVYDKLREKIEGQIVVHHMPFDKMALSEACEKYELPPIHCDWLDSAKVARRTWEKYSRRGYNLKNLASEFGIDLNHHDAFSDAYAAGKIVEIAMANSGIALEEWLATQSKPITPQKSLKQDGDPSGHLYGETILFTGALSKSRGEFAELAAKVGCNIAANVSKKVTILVVGMQDLNRLNGADKSSKHRKVEDLISRGADIQILSEKDFMEIIHE
ncbi:MAG: exonuclease domain-containing protein [Pseudomonadota bacterium]